MVVNVLTDPPRVYHTYHPPPLRASLSSQVRVKGPPGEVVHVSAVAPGSLTIVTVSCTIEQGGVSKATFAAAGAGCVAV